MKNKNICTAIIYKKYSFGFSVLTVKSWLILFTFFFIPREIPVGEPFRFCYKFYYISAGSNGMWTVPLSKALTKNSHEIEFKPRV